MGLAPHIPSLQGDTLVEVCHQRHDLSIIMPGNHDLIAWHMLPSNLCTGCPCYFWIVVVYLCVCLYCIVVYTTEEDHRSAVETFGVNKSSFVNFGASVKHNWWECPVYLATQASTMYILSFIFCSMLCSEEKSNSFCWGFQQMSPTTSFWVN